MRSNMDHNFSQVPQANIPRSVFSRTHSYKTTFDAAVLIPFYVDEVLPGDTFRVNATMFARLATPFVPIMDNIFLDTFYFFVPNRLVWNHWANFMGEEETPGDYVDQTLTYLTPQMPAPAGGWNVHTLGDYFGLPTGISNFNVLTFPFRAYNLIWNEWFRDENLQDKVVVDKDDGPDDPVDYKLLKRNKRKDYFTSCLPWPQKGPGVTIPIAGNAPVLTSATETVTGAQQGLKYRLTAGTAIAAQTLIGVNNTGVAETITSPAVTTPGNTMYPSNLYVDLEDATSATINSLRMAFQTQRLYERDARGGTRYTELIRSHFGVISPDMRLQRPEYLGGGNVRVNISPIAQTSGSGLTGQTTPQANLAAIGTAAATAMGFTKSFTEHGIIIGLLNVRADINYQQGLNRAWSRRSRFEYYWPVLANLGEQAVLNKEIYTQGTAEDEQVFGYQERWAEYRYFPSLITGKFRSTYATPLDVWHLAQHFTSIPTLTTDFIEDDPPISRALAVVDEPHFLLDCFIDCKATRPMPTYSVPGMIDHF